MGNVLIYCRQEGDLLYFLSGNLEARVSVEDGDLIDDYWWKPHIVKGKLKYLEQWKGYGSLHSHIAQRLVQGRMLEEWEKIILLDENPLHCERKNIAILEKEHVRPEDIRHDHADEGILRRCAWKLVNSGGRYYLLNKRNERLHRLIMERKLGRKLFPWENVKHYNEVQTDVRRENLYVLEGNLAWPGE